MASVEQETHRSTREQGPDRARRARQHRRREDASLAVRRYFTIPGRDPFDEVEWESRDAFIPGKDGPGVRPEGRRVPEVLVADGDEHRRAEVLPRPHVARPSASAPCAR